MSNSCQLEADLVKFVAEKAKNVKSPMNLSELCREFKKKSGTILTYHVLHCRLQRVRNKMSEIEHLDTETKVKTMFALGSPVSNGFLIELKRQAHVELDDRHRIIKYKKNGKGLQLSGVHNALRQSSDLEILKRMMKFLAKKSENATSPMTDDAFLIEFISSEGSLKTENTFQERYNQLKQQIYLAPEFDMKTKIKMMFLSNTKVHASILEELRMEAVVEVDEHQKITKYKADDGSLELETKRLPRQKKRTLWPKEDKDKLWNHIAEKSKQTKVPLNIRSLSREFVEKNGVSRTNNAVKAYIYEQLLPKISKLDIFDMETKIRMLFALRAPVDQKFLNKLRKKASVKIDKKRRIAKYKATNRSLELNGDHSQSAKIKTVHAQKKSKSNNSEYSETDDETEDYDDEKDEEEEKEKNEDDDEDMEELSRPNTRSAKLSKRRYPKVDPFCDSDDDACKSSRNIKKTKIQRTEKITKKATSQTQTGIKNRNMCDSDTGKETEDEESEEEYEEKEEVKNKTSSTRRSERISKNRKPDNDSVCDFNDVSFDSPENANDLRVEKETEKLVEMPSDSSPEAPLAKNLKGTKKGRKSRNVDDSETNEKAEDEKSKKEHKEDEEVKTNSSTRRSEGISENRYLGYDFTSGLDDVSFDSPENASDSKIEEETEKLVKLPSESSSETPLVKNLKRTIVENQFDDTSSSPKSKKIGRTTVSRNETESDKIDSGKKQNEGEVEYGVTGESLSHKKVKLENIAYKPDLSFFCNVNQDNMPHFSRTDGYCNDDVEQSTGNTEEMTSGKEFMKSLACLVDTLDSPILAKLQSKIEKAIEEIGDEDHKIPTDEIARTLDNGLFLLNKNATIKPRTREYISLRDFLLILRSILSTFRSSSLNTFQLKLKANIKKLDSQDKVILLDSIERVLETVLLLAMP